ncbi:MAG: chemotaxis protein CheA, partial [Hyphomonas sp.]|nr:chemotaxis protein CheA [Hyphomonas sp.]
MEEIRQTFFVECGELLEAMEAGLLAMQDGDDDPETVNAVFRAAHSIKGGAGAFAYTDLVRFAHKFESILDEIRSNRLEASRPVVDVMLRASDVLGDLVRVAQSGAPFDQENCDALIAEFDTLSTKTPEEDITLSEDDFEPLVLSFDFGAIGGDESDEPGELAEPAAPSGYVVTFHPMPSLLRHGSEPALIFRELERLGPTTVNLDASAVPALDELDPLGNYCRWKIDVECDDEAAIRAVFEFVDSDCELEIAPRVVLADINQNAEDDSAELQFPAAAAFEAVAEAAAEAVESEPAIAAPLAEVVPLDTAREAGPAKAPAALAAAGDSGARSSGGGGATVRVDLDKVDRLINLIGELVVNQAMLSQSLIDAGLTAGTAAAAGLDEFKQLTREVQDSVMAIRAQPVKSLFQRMSRIVREAAAATGKDARLKIEGEMTEVDKTVVEQLADPLTHMIRNAVDHGLETPEERVKNGKTPEGAIRLSAAHRSGRVIIEVADDGAGINRERVRQIAIDKGLIAADANLTAAEIDNILFLPGFSTAKTLSDLSGRGVGMDVVKRSIQALGGKISIRSTPGQGSTFVISLPLTLAVLDGMVVQVAGETLVIPITSIVETIKPDPAMIHPLGSDGQVVLVRGAFVPVVDVGVTLGMRAPLRQLDGQVLVLVE